MVESFVLFVDDLEFVSSENDVKTLVLQNELLNMVVSNNNCWNFTNEFFAKLKVEV